VSLFSTNTAISETNLVTEVSDQVSLVVMKYKKNLLHQRMHLLSNLMKGKYLALKKIAEDRKEWQKLIRAESHTPAS